MFPSTQKDRTNVLEPRNQCPFATLSKPSFNFHLSLPLSHLALLLSHWFFFISGPLYPSPPILALLISPVFPSSPLLAFASVSSLPAAASWCCSHFSSPGAHSQVQGNVWLYLCGTSILLDSYCFGTEVPPSKLIKGQFNSKFMKGASVKVLSPVYFVCSQGASSMHRKPSVTPVPFSFLIRNYWVVSLTQCWISTPKRTSLLLSVG